MGLIGVLVISGIVMLLDWASLLILLVTADSNNLNAPPSAAVSSLESASSFIGIANFAVLVYTAVYVCKWMYRGTKNMLALGMSSTRVSPGWAVGWWFIPIACLWMPYRAMSDIYKVSKNNSGIRFSAYDNDNTVGWWWTYWLLPVAIGLLAGILTLALISSNGFNLEGIIVISMISGGLSYACNIMSAMLLMRILENVNEWQKRWAFMNPEPSHRFCGNCGYDLRFTASASCPECGYAIEGYVPQSVAE